MAGPRRPQARAARPAAGRPMGASIKPAGKPIRTLGRVAGTVARRVPGLGVGMLGVDALSAIRGRGKAAPVAGRRPRKRRRSVYLGSNLPTARMSKRISKRLHDYRKMIRKVESAFGMSRYSKPMQQERRRWSPPHRGKRRSR